MDEKPPLILSRGSLSALSDEELKRGVEELQARREALVAEARQRNAEKLPKGARGPRPASAEDLALLAILKGTS